MSIICPNRSGFCSAVCFILFSVQRAGLWRGLPVWQTPVWWILMRTSPALGGATSMSSTDRGAPASQAMAACQLFSVVHDPCELCSSTSYVRGGRIELTLQVIVCRFPSQQGYSVKKKKEQSNLPVLLCWPLCILIFKTTTLLASPGMPREK